METQFNYEVLAGLAHTPLSQSSNFWNYKHAPHLASNFSAAVYHQRLLMLYKLLKSKSLVYENPCNKIILQNEARENAYSNFKILIK